MQIMTVENRVHQATQLLDSISDSNTSYYMFTSKHTPFSANNDDPEIYPLYDNENFHSTVYKDMIFGKKIAEGDVALMISKYLYVPNKVYDMYDDLDKDLISKKFFVVVDNGAQFHIFKCLNNNNNSLSTVTPDIAVMNVSDELVIASDGYIWKFMYTVAKTDVDKFGNVDYIPFFANSLVSSFAVPGTIDSFKIETTGIGYNNHLKGIFVGSDLRIESGYVYNVSGNNVASAINGFYEGCILKIVAGTGVGQYAKVIDYTVNATHKVVTLNKLFSTPLSHLSEYEISPGITVSGDGFETINAEARAIVSLAGNSINSIEVLNKGQHYRTATATVELPNVVIPSQQIQLRPIISPRNGHGSDPAVELGATRICFSTTFSNNETGTIPATNSFRQVGILKNPIFSESTFATSNVSGVFRPGEQIVKTNLVEIATTSATINTTSSVVNCVSADFKNQLDVGESILLKSSTSVQFATVNSITNSSSLVIKKANGSFACTSTKIFKLNVPRKIDNFSLQTNVLTGTLSVNTGSNAAIVGTGTQFVSQLLADSYVYVAGNSTGYGDLRRVVQVVNNTIAIVNSAFTFSNALSKGNSFTAGFTTNTIPYVATATIQATPTNELDVEDINGIFSPSDLIVGRDSGATATISNISRSGINKNFNTYVQMHKYIGSVVSGVFQQNEIVYQGNQLENRLGYLHSVVGSSDPREFYISSQNGTINTGDTITGANSGAIATLTTRYSPELVPGSGKILFVQNYDAIPRSNTTSEQFKLIFSF